jgi:hypothetical protein
MAAHIDDGEGRFLLNFCNLFYNWTLMIRQDSQMVGWKRRKIIKLNC